MKLLRGLDPTRLIGLVYLDTPMRKIQGKLGIRNFLKYSDLLRLLNNVVSILFQQSGERAPSRERPR